jgi:hypothetical protein
MRDERSRADSTSIPKLSGEKLGAKKSSWLLNARTSSIHWDPHNVLCPVRGQSTIDDIVEFYKREHPKRIQRHRSTPGEQLAKEVDFFGMTKGPSIWFLGLANNHGVHHRRQLTTLRAMGSKVPSIYGGSADERFRGA